ncbi:MAG: single-stranded DNA-binding protein [Clostridia bacterium]
MDVKTENNVVRLAGSIAGRPTLSHESRGEAFYRLPLCVRRLSGAEDELPLLLRRRQLETLELQEADRLAVCGELRSFNNRSGEGARLVLTVFVRSLAFSDGEDENSVRLRGTLCRPPTLRRTPMGREICDLMLAVSRPYGRSDYLPCICWGPLAREFSACPTGTVLQLSGRFQSRPYIKMTEAGPIPRVAYEVSAAEIEKTGL